MNLYKQSLALLTDLYQVTMAYAYWKNNLHTKEAAFHLFYRKRPFGGGYTIAAGLELAIQFLENYRFDTSDLDYLSTLRGADGEPLFEDQKFFKYLQKLRFTCDVDAMPEGTPVFPQEPILRVIGPVIQAQLLESPLLNLINFSSLIATKASRVCMAAAGDSVLEFGLRRAQGIDGAMTASRSAYIGGCDSTSNVLAGKVFGIPVRGTHSHSWVMLFDDEIDSFRAYAQALPANCIFLVDTYNSLEGVKKAIEVGQWLKSQGKKMLGVRLDSGDLAYLSKETRRLLDEAGFKDVLIVASNELDENIIHELKNQKAPIAVWGVGTNLITAKDQPALDGVYKLSAIRDPGQPWQFRLKLSEQMIKISNPGILQVRRFGSHEYIADAIYNESSPPEQWRIIDPLDSTRQKTISKTTHYSDLLIPVYRQGKLVYNIPSLASVRDFAKDQLQFFHEGIKRFMYPHQYVAGLEKSLYEFKLGLIKKVRNLQ